MMDAKAYRHAIREGRATVGEPDAPSPMTPIRVVVLRALAILAIAYAVLWALGTLMRA